MFNEFQGLLQRVTTGEIDQTSVSQAATEHISSMDHAELQRQVQSAAGNAQNNGQPDIAQRFSTLLAQSGSNPQNLREQIVSLIRSNPQILQHFEPQFVQNLLNRI